MIDSEKGKFGELLKATMDVYGKETSVGMVQVWWEALKRFEYAEVRRSLSQHLQNVDSGQFAPRPADIIRVIEGGGSEGRALGAWTKVLEAVRRVGSWRSVVFDDPLIHAAIEDMGGWVALCAMTEDEAPFKGNEFQKRYRALIHNRPSSYPARLIGYADGGNRMGGHDSEDETVLIGNIDECRRLLSEGATGPRLKISRASDLISRVPAAIEHKQDASADE